MNTCIKFYGPHFSCFVSYSLSWANELVFCVHVNANACTLICNMPKFKYHMWCIELLTRHKQFHVHIKLRLVKCNLCMDLMSVLAYERAMWKKCAEHNKKEHIKSENGDWCCCYCCSFSISTNKNVLHLDVCCFLLFYGSFMVDRTDNHRSGHANHSNLKWNANDPMWMTCFEQQPDLPTQIGDDAGGVCAFLIVLALLIIRTITCTIPLNCVVSRWWLWWCDSIDLGTQTQTHTHTH